MPAAAGSAHTSEAGFAGLLGALPPADTCPPIMLLEAQARVTAATGTVSGPNLVVPVQHDLGGVVLGVAPQLHARCGAAARHCGCGQPLNPVFKF